MSLTDLLSSFLGTVHADAPAEEDKGQADKESAQEEPEAEEESPAAEEEEEEPEDIHPGLREECQQSAKCAPLTQHFLHCQEKVSAGEGFKHEDCVEELFHMMHCVDNCVAPKLFSKLK
ncbi:Non-heme 11 kDa protein of cytochrome bc1 complex [Punctularia strigosozonata HHB-11173 SS5]|uniref:Non-heme 11 kDa protein of cytochrome bc1 complex n=1 Tax=Punctularia strigosozonata (strain HHB-11173) TaxID=741275 RepID=R7S3Y8_PUNST|nr:Non-heme 11 kDa protein of cytochrome bc1 complex [Punctularia strigosozonata HHB-11173 SS5]EIN05100.1 Non-heme 11 kDa protein of cytochrome bc1 complex [Punctularia strigosozonata HHB-11173 SS5]